MTPSPPMTKQHPQVAQQSLMRCGINHLVLYETVDDFEDLERQFTEELQHTPRLKQRCRFRSFFKCPC